MEIHAVFQFAVRSGTRPRTSRFYFSASMTMASLPYDVLLDVFDEVDFRNGKRALESCRRACGLWREAAGDCEARAAVEWEATLSPMLYATQRDPEHLLFIAYEEEDMLREAKYMGRFFGLTYQDMCEWLWMRELQHH